MKKIKTTIIISLSLGCLICLFILALFLYVKNEGYPTIEAMYNRIFIKGSIAIVLPDDMPNIDMVSCDYSNKIEKNLRSATIYIGKTWCDINIKTKEKDGIVYSLSFCPQKLNDWNRIIYLPKGKNSWCKYENGIIKYNTDFKIEKIESNKINPLDDICQEGNNK